MWQARYQGQQLLQTHSVATGALGQSWECIGVVPNISTITGHHTNPASMPIRLAYRLGEGEKIRVRVTCPTSLLCLCPLKGLRREKYSKVVVGISKEFQY